jgi:hypothetical protein
LSLALLLTRFGEDCKQDEERFKASKRDLVLGVPGLALVRRRWTVSCLIETYGDKIDLPVEVEGEAACRPEGEKSHRVASDSPKVRRDTKGCERLGNCCELRFNLPDIDYRQGFVVSCVQTLAMACIV